MPNFSIDGKEIPFQKGDMIIQAADRAGIYIPRFCYHPSKEVGIEGNCRICLVEVEKMPKLQIACKTAVAENMVVKTTTPQVKKAREGVMEFLLTSHPLDCPVCDQSGECDLQNYAFNFGLDKSRYREEKTKKQKHKIIGPHVILDSERCVLCSRCVRFLNRVTKTGELGFRQRGAKTTLDIAPGKTLDNNYSGNVAQLCPVGALTSRDFRFKARAWHLDRSDSVCPDCATGCNISVDAIGGKVYKLDYQVFRFNARANDAVNSHWICDEGRFGYKWINSEDRLRAPMVKHGGSMDAIRMAAALEQAAVGLKRVKEAHGPASIAGIGSARFTNEENWLLKKLVTEALGSANLDFVGEHGDNSALEDGILLRKDRNPNSKGCVDIGMKPGNGGKDLEGIIKGLEDGSIKAVVLLSVGVKMDEKLRARLAKAMTKAEFSVLVDCIKTELCGAASVVLSNLAFAEIQGTYTNYSGMIQRLMPTVPQKGEARAGWEILRDLVAKCGAPAKYADAFAVTKELIGAAGYKGVKVEDIGPCGVRPGAEPGTCEVTPPKEGSAS